MYREGHEFEKQVDKVIAYINNLGYHAHKNNPKRSLDGTFLQGEPFDYIALLPDEHHCFDTKTCATNSWQMKPKDISQTERLKHCKNANCKAYFLINFKNAGVKQIDVDTIIEYLKINKKTIPVSCGTEWELVRRLKNGFNK